MRERKREKVRKRKRNSKIDRERIAEKPKKEERVFIYRPVSSV